MAQAHCSPPPTRGRRPLAAAASSRGRSRRRGVALGDGGRAAAAHWTSGGDPGLGALTAAATAAGSRWELGRSVRSVMRGCGGAPGAGPAGESAGGGRRGPGRWRRGLAAAPRPGPGGGPPSRVVLGIGGPQVTRSGSVRARVPRPRARKGEGGFA